MILVVCFMPLKNNGQDTLTNGEVYDYEVGDVFHFRGHNTTQSGYYYYSVKNIEIAEKYYSIDNDTIFYFINVDFKDSSVVEPYWQYNYYTETIAYYDLNQYLIEIDEIYSDPLLYNGRTINKSVWYDGPISGNAGYVMGCGIAFSHYYDASGSTSSSGQELVYYNKNGEEWGTPLIVTGFDENRMTSSLINIYPNPASDFITINTKEGIAIEEAIIYNHLGQKVLEALPVNNKMDVSKLKPGIYLVGVITMGNHFLIKLVID